MTTAPTQFIREATIVRRFQAPRELVFAAFTQPEHLSRWWAPQHFGARNAAVDLRPGGVFRIDMVAPDGTVLPGGGEVVEVDPPSRFIFRTTAFPDEAGGAKLVGLNFLTLTEEHGVTTLHLHVGLVSVAPELAEGAVGMEQGWRQSLDKLDNLLAETA